MNAVNFFNKVMMPALFALYIFVVIKVILFKFGPIEITFLWHQLQQAVNDPDSIQNRLQFANFTPFESIGQNLQRLSSPHDVINLFGNIAIFVPYGLLITVMNNGSKMSFPGVLVRSFAFSLSLECSQVVFSIGSFDVDDLILNTSGGVIGYAILRVIRMLGQGGVRKVEGTQGKRREPIEKNVKDHVLDGK